MPLPAILPNYLHAMRALGCDFRVLMTTSAEAILPAATVALVAPQVFTEAEHRFAPGLVALATWADQIVILPATAHMLGQAAHGLAGNLLASTCGAGGRNLLGDRHVETGQGSRHAVADRGRRDCGGGTCGISRRR